MCPGRRDPGTSAVNGMAHSRDIRSPGTATSALSCSASLASRCACTAMRHCSAAGEVAGGAVGRAGGQLAVDERRDGLLGEVALGDAHGATAAARGEVGQGLAQLHPAAVDAAAHRAELDAEGRRDLLVGQALDVAEDDGDAELRRAARRAPPGSPGRGACRRRPARGWARCRAAARCPRAARRSGSAAGGGPCRGTGWS